MLCLAQFIIQKSVSYTSLECFDYENTMDGTIQLGERCNPDILHNLEQRSRGQVLQRAKISEKNSVHISTVRGLFLGKKKVH